MIICIHSHLSLLLCWSSIKLYPQHPEGDRLLFGKRVLDRLVRDTELAVVGLNSVNEAKGDQDHQDETPVLDV